MGAALFSLLAAAGFPLIAGGTLGMAAMTVSAQSSVDSDDDEARNAKRALLVALSKPVTLDVTDQPLEDIIAFLRDVTGADLEPIYLDDDSAAGGMDPATPVTIKVSQTPALVVLERVLLRAQRAEAVGEEYTWQFTDYGTMEMGPKSELNRNQRLEIYDVSDLLYVVPDFDNAPEFDLQSAVQAAGGGGGGQAGTGGGAR
ncbi:MAG: hypothetical protein WD114_02015, partial [Phycisphaerales bacterium]